MEPEKEKVDSVMSVNKVPEQNQMIVNKNLGTINITNNFQCSDKAIEAFVETEKLSNKNILEFITFASNTANKIIELERFKRETEKEKNTRKQ